MKDLGLTYKNNALQLITNINTQNLALRYFQEPAYSSDSAGFGSEKMYGGMQVEGSCFSYSYTGGRGAFTAAQWLELEHQIWIYSFITANVPVPVDHLIPIRHALTCSRSRLFPIGSYHPHDSSNERGSSSSPHPQPQPQPQGISGDSDPKARRCKRTDGKKWQCSKIAVPNKKYCQRHINRGRHRKCCKKPLPVDSNHTITITPLATSTITSDMVTPPMLDFASIPSMLTYTQVAPFYSN